jgi:hypothetical protein
MSYYGSDLDVEYGDGGEVEIEIENQDERAQLRDRGQELLQDLDPSSIRNLLGR